MSLQSVLLPLAAMLSAGVAERPADSCTGPEYFALKPPAYPPAAVRDRVEGQVVIRVNLEPNGNVSSTLVEASSGNAELDQAALDAAKQWKYTGRVCGGVGVASAAMVPFNFSLDVSESSPANFKNSLEGTAVDNDPLEFKTISEGLAYLQGTKGIGRHDKGSLVFFDDPSNLKFWHVTRTPMGYYGAIFRVRLERTASGYRQLYRALCEADADWCNFTYQGDVQFLRENPVPIPPPRPRQSPDATH